MGLLDGPNTVFGAPGPMCPHFGKIGKGKRAAFDRFFLFLIGMRRNRRFLVSFWSQMEGGRYMLKHTRMGP